jgi:hypothetical protein
MANVSHQRRGIKPWQVHVSHQRRGIKTWQVQLAFLAPDILEQIITGDHSHLLKPERLRKACPLPMDWQDQRALLQV